jgi:MFS family permease
LASRKQRSDFADLLADGSFRSVWITGTLTGILRWLELLAIGVFTFQVTGSALAVSLMTMLRMAPLFVFGIPMGALADRFDRKTLLMLGLSVLALSSLSVAALAFFERLLLWHVGLSAFLNGVFWAAEFPIRRTMLGEIAGQARLGAAMALESSTSNATRMAGPALGGLLLETTGLAGVFAGSLPTYVLGHFLILPRAYRSGGRGSSIGVLDPILEGWRAVRGSRMILASLAITMIVNFWGFAYISMVPVIGERQLGLSTFLIGLLASTEGLGALIGSIMVGVWGRPSHYTRIYLYSSCVFLGMVLGFGLSDWLPLSFALMLAAGISISGFAVMQATITFLASPPEMRSRVMGVLTVTIGTSPIGMLHLGLLAEWFGAGTAVMIMAAEGLIALALVAYYWPEMRRESILSG